jgi:hypothetical protein
MFCNILLHFKVVLMFLKISNSVFASGFRTEILSAYLVSLFSLYTSSSYSWNWTLTEKPPIGQLLKNFPAFYGTRWFITVLTRALHRSLSWARSIQSIPSHHISLRSILILSTHLLLGLPSGPFPSGFPTSIPYAFLFASFMLHTMPISFSLTWSF